MLMVLMAKVMSWDVRRWEACAFIEAWGQSRHHEGICIRQPQPQNPGTRERSVTPRGPPEFQKIGIMRCSQRLCAKAGQAGRPNGDLCHTSRAEWVSAVKRRIKSSPVRASAAQRGNPSR